MEKLSKDEMDLIQLMAVDDDGEVLFPGDGLKLYETRRVAESMIRKGVIECSSYGGKIHYKVPKCYDKAEVSQISQIQIMCKYPYFGLSGL